MRIPQQRAPNSTPIVTVKRDTCSPGSTEELLNH